MALVTWLNFFFSRQSNHLIIHPDLSLGQLISEEEEEKTQTNGAVAENIYLTFTLPEITFHIFFGFDILAVCHTFLLGQFNKLRVNPLPTVLTLPSLIHLFKGPSSPGYAPQGKSFPWRGEQYLRF